MQLVIVIGVCAIQLSAIVHCGVSQDATFEFERKRNRPERYDRNVVENTMKKIEEIRLKREEKFWESR